MHGRDCSNCTYFGHERVMLRGTEYGSCRVDGPSISSTYIGSGFYGDAWIGQWPFVSQDAWCGRFVKDASRVATSVSVGNPTLE